MAIFQCYTTKTFCLAAVYIRVNLSHSLRQWEDGAGGGEKVEEKLKKRGLQLSFGGLNASDYVPDFLCRLCKYVM